MENAQTLKEVQTLCLELFKCKAVKATIEARKKEENDKIAKLEFKIIQAFEDAGCEKQSIPGVGAVFLKNLTSYRTPKSDEQKALLREFMGAEKWDAMASINSRTLNTWANEEFEAAVEEGNHNFAIPGLDEPSLTMKVATRKE